MLSVISPAAALAYRPLGHSRKRSAMSRSDENIRQGVSRYLDQGEEVVATLAWAKPRWSNTRGAGGGVAGAAVGAALRGRAVTHRSKGTQRGLEFAPGSTAFVITSERFITLSTTQSKMKGEVTAVEFLSAIPIAEIKSIRAKRLGLTGVLTITPQSGDAFQFQTSAGAAKTFAAESRKAVTGIAP